MHTIDSITIMGVYLSKVFESCFLTKDDNLIKGKLQVIKRGDITNYVTSPLELIDLYVRSNYWYNCCNNTNNYLERLNNNHNGMRNLFSSLDGLKKIKNKFIEWSHVIKRISNSEMHDADKISSINDALSHDSMFKFLTTNGELKKEHNITMNRIYVNNKQFKKIYKKKAMNCFKKDKTNFCITLAKLYEILSVIIFCQGDYTLSNMRRCRRMKSEQLNDLFLSSNVSDMGIYSTWQSNNMAALEGMINYIEVIKTEYMRLCFKYSISNTLYLKYDREYYKKFNDYLNMCSDNIFYRLPIDLQVYVLEYLADSNLLNIKTISNVFWSDKQYISRYQKKKEYFDIDCKVGDEVFSITSGYSWGKIVSINYKNKCVELSNYRIAKFKTYALRWIPKKHYTLYFISRPSLGSFAYRLNVKKYPEKQRMCFKKYLLEKKYVIKDTPSDIEADGSETTQTS